MESDPTDLTGDFESAVRQKALSMAMEAHGICLEHLLSSIARSYQNEIGRGSENGVYQALKLVEDTNLDRALAHKPRNLSWAPKSCVIHWCD